MKLFVHDYPVTSRDTSLAELEQAIDNGHISTVVDARTTYLGVPHSLALYRRLALHEAMPDLVIESFGISGPLITHIQTSEADGYQDFNEELFRQLFGYSTRIHINTKIEKTLSGLAYVPDVADLKTLRILADNGYSIVQFHMRQK
jgi:hypothetical protein